MENNLCLEVKNLKKYFPVGKNFFGKPNAFLKAVDDISFTIEKGTTLGLVGESGCGKTTVGRSILRLHEVTGGQVLFKGLDLATVSKKELRRMRPQMQIIFQDPYSSLSPRMPVGAIIGEAVKAHKIVPKKEFEDYILGVMQSCGLQRQYYDRYPHEFSGGQRQRICIARALALKPEFIVCDEPVSALDVSVQAQIINLLTDFQEKFGFSYLFISHDLSVVEHLAPCRRDVSRKYCRAGQQKADLRQSDASLYPRVAFRCSDARPDREDEPYYPSGRPAVPLQSAQGLQILHPLPRMQADLP